MITAEQALKKLSEGNPRFASGIRGEEVAHIQSTRERLVGGQQSFATIVGCSDSWVPVVRIFDQGLGDLFVVRVGGNVVAPTQIGSVEFAVENLACPLVVLRHPHCGAVQATLGAIREPSEAISPNLGVDHRVDSTGDGGGPRRLGRRARGISRGGGGRANVHTSIQRLKERSEIINERLARKQLLLVGAIYSLETGRVAWREPPFSEA